MSTRRHSSNPFLRLEPLSPWQGIWFWMTVPYAHKWQRPVEGTFSSQGQSTVETYAGCAQAGTQRPAVRRPERFRGAEAGLIAR